MVPLEVVHSPALRGAAVRLLLFCLGAWACLAASIAAASLIVGWLGATSSTLSTGLTSAFLAALLLMGSAWLLRQERASIDSLGLPTDRVRVRLFGIGLVSSTAAFLAVAWVQSTMVGASWTFHGFPGFVAAGISLATMGGMVLVEELLFRGVGLRYLRALFGDTAAIVLSALAFGAYHVIGSSTWAMGTAFIFLMSVAGGLLFGWAAVRSGGLALPIGLHLGGNWVQVGLARFAPPMPAEATPSVEAMWRIPITGGDVDVLTAPDLPARLPYLLAFALLAIVVGRVARVPSIGREDSLPGFR